jgi:electron transport complex protein RnfC
VRRGEPLSADGPHTSSPADGRIIGVSRQVLVGGKEIETVELEVETTDLQTPEPASTADRARQVLADLASESLEFHVANFADAGIAADRWTNPDFAAQIAQTSRKRVDTVLCCALDLDPVLAIQQSLCIDHALDLTAGTKGLAKIAGATRVIIALPEDSPSEVIVAMRTAAAVMSARLYPLRGEYPTANPSLLIRRMLGRRLRPGLLPPQVGVLFVDAQLAVAVGRFLIRGEPMLSVPFGLYQWGRARAHIVRVTIGTRLRDLLKALAVPDDESDLRSGHVLRETRATPDAIIAGGELTLVASEPAAPPAASACLRCGWCVDACPARIHPAGLLDAAQQQDLGLGHRYGLRSCIECGICTYVCPSKLPLLQAIRVLRAG